MVSSARLMAGYRLLQLRRHVFQLLRGNESAAEIALHGARANIVSGGERYDLEAIEDVRKRVVKFDGRHQTVARSSWLERYAVDLDDVTLYWHSLPHREYCWMTAGGAIAAKYSPAEDGAWTIDSDIALPVLILGSYLMLRATATAREIQWQPSLAFNERSR